MLSNKSSNGNKKFYTSSIRLAPEDVKYIKYCKVKRSHRNQICFKINYNEALKKLFLNFSFILKIERVMSFQTLSHFLVVTLYFFFYIQFLYAVVKLVNFKVNICKEMFF